MIDNNIWTCEYEYKYWFDCFFFRHPNNYIGNVPHQARIYTWAKAYICINSEIIIHNIYIHDKNSKW